MTQTKIKYECPYDDCSWAHTTQTDRAVIYAAYVEQKIRDHLDDDHPEWSRDELERMREERMAANRPVGVTMVETDRNPAHVRVKVWAGRNKGSRALAGELTFRTDEWDELREQLEDMEASVRHLIQSSSLLARYDRTFDIDAPRMEWT